MFSFLASLWMHNKIDEKQGDFFFNEKKKKNKFHAIISSRDSPNEEYEDLTGY